MTKQKISNKDNKYKPLPIPTREEWHRTFGGSIYYSDFNIGYLVTMMDIANDIISDFKFDNMCMANIAARERSKKYNEGDCKNE